MNSFNYLSFKKTFNLFIPNIFKNKQSRRSVFVTVILIIIDILVTSILLPHFSKQIAQSFTIPLFPSLGIGLLIFGSLWTLEKILNHLQDILFFPAINNNIQTITYRVVEKIHQVPLALYQNLSIPEVINAVRRISMSARSFIKIFVLLFIPTFIKVCIAIYSSLSFGYEGYILIPTFLLCLGLLYLSTQWYVKTREASWQFSDKVVMRIQDSILNTKITRFYLEDEMTAVASLLKREADLWHSTNTRLHLIHVFIASLLGAVFTFILYRFFQDISKNNLSVGDFLLLKTQLIAAFLPFKQLSIEFRQLAEASIDVKKIIQVLELPEENNIALQNSAPSFITNIKDIHRTIICCQDLDFGYKDNILLNQVSFNFAYGEKIAILGENGSGKSSLLRLLSGLEIPQQGSIYLHGRQIRQYSRNQLNKILHYIPQDLRLFNISLRENVSYGSKNCSDSLILEVLEAVDLLPMLSQLPQGLNSMVGELGTLLSGGEIQRIALARAMMMKPEILLLDETLHSLNIESEKRILETLYQWVPTVVLISHRPSTLQWVDRAYRISKGTILELEFDKQSTSFTQILETQKKISALSEMPQHYREHIL